MGTDLLFLSHARAVGARARTALPRLGLGGGVRVLCTELTLALLGPAGERLRRHALLPGVGRPFSLGGVRLELFSSGYMPGAASLLCEWDGRRVVYAGLLGAADLDPTGAGAGGRDVRAADAVCVDAGNLVTGEDLLDRRQALDELGREVRVALGEGATPVLLVDPIRTAMAAGLALASDRIPLRGHREVVQVAAAFREAGLPAPRLERFSGKAGLGEVLLWPAGEAPPPRRSGSRPHRLILMGGEGGTTGGPAWGAPAAVVRYPTGPSVADLLGYVEASGARELAVVNAPGEPLFAPFLARGIAAYALGPPRQIGLFSRPAGVGAGAAL